MMSKDKRPGAYLWQEWEGDGWRAKDESSIIYFTLGDVDVENEVVCRALASALQRDGVSDSLGDGFKMIDKGDRHKDHAGIVDGEGKYTICSDDGETYWGDSVEEVFVIHLVELYA